MVIWNPWHGCRKVSPGCAHCYVYRRDESVGKDASVIAKTGNYNLPLRRRRDGAYKVTPEDGRVWCCMTSDFFIDQADGWRQGCWDAMRERPELDFTIVTKRTGRIAQCLPPDWGEGWPNVTFCATCEDQVRADERIGQLLAAPAAHRQVISEPMLGPLDLASFLGRGKIEQVICGGESGPEARPCLDEWVLGLRAQCIAADVAFTFKQTGANYVKGGRTYHMERRLQMTQARKSGYSWRPGKGSMDAL